MTVLYPADRPWQRARTVSTFYERKTVQIAGFRHCGDPILYALCRIQGYRSVLRCGTGAARAHFANESGPFCAAVLARWSVSLAPRPRFDGSLASGI